MLDLVIQVQPINTITPIDGNDIGANPTPEVPKKRNTGSAIKTTKSTSIERR